ncbi:hypothetical protein THRCLA_00931 [Thraustotheca clavata]|uniref:FYVE-type domain-containing protein n=1 Tax=Thraustotheca clavata TaxID=74557 RepID=A0A1W0AA61_9STRA|nr:hypothetical protein THRCLA_00931 [Thraustotheca clavata]
MTATTASKAQWWEDIYLTPRERRWFIQEGRKAFDALLTNTKLVGRSGRLFKSCGDTTNKEYYFGYASTVVQESFPAVRARYSTIIHQRDEYCRVFTLVDTHILCIVQAPGVCRGEWHTPSTASIVLRWMAWKPTIVNAKPRDYLVLEYIDTIVNAKGERCYGRVWHSVSHRACPHQYGFERQVMVHSGDVLFSNSESKTVFAVRVMLYQVNSIKTHIPKWVAERLLRREIRQQYQSHLDLLLWNHTPMDVYPVDASQVIELDADDSDFYMLECNTKYESIECDLCNKKFGIFRFKFNCLECDKIICKKCSTGFNTLRNKTMKDIKRNRVCFSCYGHMNHSLHYLSLTGPF